MAKWGQRFLHRFSINKKLCRSFYAREFSSNNYSFECRWRQYEINGTKFIRWFPVFTGSFLPFIPDCKRFEAFWNKRQSDGSRRRTANKEKYFSTKKKQLSTKTSIIITKICKWTKNTIVIDKRHRKATIFRHYTPMIIGYDGKNTKKGNPKTEKGSFIFSHNCFSTSKLITHYQAFTCIHARSATSCGNLWK